MTDREPGSAPLVDAQDPRSLVTTPPSRRELEAMLDGVVRAHKRHGPWWWWFHPRIYRLLEPDTRAFLDERRSRGDNVLEHTACPIEQVVVTHPIPPDEMPDEPAPGEQPALA